MLRCIDPGGHGVVVPSPHRDAPATTSVEHDGSGRSLDRGTETGLTRTFHGDGEVERLEHFANTVDVRVLDPEARQAAPAWESLGGMGGLAPIDEERHGAIESARKRIGEAPLERRPVGGGAPETANRPRIYSDLSKRPHGCLQVGNADGPIDQAGGLDIVDAEPSRSIRLGLIGVDRGYLQVASWTESQEHVARAPALVTSARDRRHAQAGLDIGRGTLQVASGEDDVVDPPEGVGHEPPDRTRIAKEGTS